MSDSFCIQCGAPLEGNTQFCGGCGAAVAPQTFCVQCGLPLDPSVRFCENCGVSVGAGVSTGTGTVAGSGAYDDFHQAHTAQNPVVASSQTSQQEYGWQAIGQQASPAQPQKKPNTTILAIIVAFAVLALGAGVALAILKPWEPSVAASTQPTTPSESGRPSDALGTAPSNQESGAAAEAPDEPAIDEQAIYDELTGYYSKIAGLDARIRACATDFNNTYTLSDYATRSANSTVASTLADELTLANTSLGILEVSSDSINYQAYRDIRTLYNALLQRILVISEAWKISLSYSNPADHTSEITAPIARDNVNGTNKYKTEFDALLPNVTLKTP